VLQNALLFVILQQKILIKSDDDDVDIQNNESVTRSFDVQGHEECIPKAFSVKTEPEVGLVSFSFCCSYSCMWHFVVVVVVVVVVQVFHNMEQNVWIFQNCLICVNSILPVETKKQSFCNLLFDLCVYSVVARFSHNRIQ